MCFDFFIPISLIINRCEFNFTVYFQFFLKAIGNVFSKFWNKC
jgi:hypothetical protein